MRGTDNKYPRRFFSLSSAFPREMIGWRAFLENVHPHHRQKDTEDFPVPFLLSTEIDGIPER